MIVRIGSAFEIGMAGGSDVRKIPTDRVRLVTIAIKKISLAILANTKHIKLMEDLPMENKTPVLVIIYLYDEESGKLTMLVNIYYI